MTTLEKLEAAREAANSAPANLVAIFTNHRAISEKIARLQAPILCRVASQCVPFDHGASMVLLSPSALDLSELSQLETIMRVIESDPMLGEAQETIEPLLAEIAALEARLAQENAELAERHQSLVDAEQAATAAALAKVEKDPAVIKARAALEGIKRLGEPLLAD